MTTKKDLLHIAEQCSSSGEAAMELAGQLVTAEDVALKKASVKQIQEKALRKAAVLDVIRPILGVAAVVAIIIAAVNPSHVGATEHYWPGWLFAFLTLSWMISAYSSDKAEQCVRESRYILNAAVPIATATPEHGLNLCEEAMTYIAAGRPEVLAWRELAIAERGQLYAFDVEVMRSIDEKLTEDEATAANDALNKEAFKLAHTLGRPGFDSNAVPA